MSLAVRLHILCRSSARGAATTPTGGSLASRNTTQDIVDAQHHGRRLDRSLERLDLDLPRLPYTQLGRVHVRDHALRAVDPPGLVHTSRVLRTQLRYDADDLGAAVLRERARDHLQRVCDREHGLLLHALHRLSRLAQVRGDGHLDRTTAGQHEGVVQQVPGHRHGVLQVALDLVQHVLRRAAQQQRARLGLLALRQEAEVLVADLLDLEQAAADADRRLVQVLGAVDDLGTDGARDAVVVRLAQAAA